MFPDPATVDQDGGFVNSWSSNLGSLSGFIMFDGENIYGTNQSTIVINWADSGFCAILNPAPPSMLYTNPGDFPFTYQDMTFVCVCQIDLAASIGVFPRILSMVNNALNEDDFTSPSTAVIAYNDTSVDSSLSEDINSNVANPAGSDITVPCIIAFRTITQFPNKTLTAFWQPLATGSTLNNSTFTGSLSPFNSDTFTAFLSFLNTGDNSAQGFISLIAGWDRGISDAEITTAFAYLTTLYGL